MFEHSRCGYSPWSPGSLFCFLIQTSKVRLIPGYIIELVITEWSASRRLWLFNYHKTGVVYDLMHFALLLLTYLVFSAFRKEGGNLSAGRIAIQSLCAPQCGYFGKASFYLKWCVLTGWWLDAAHSKFEAKFYASSLPNQFSHIRLFMHCRTGTWSRFSDHWRPWCAHLMPLPL